MDIERRMQDAEENKYKFAVIFAVHGRPADWPLRHVTGLRHRVRLE